MTKCHGSFFVVILFYERKELPYDEKKKTWKNNYVAKHYEEVTSLRVSSEYINREYYKRAKEAFNNIQSTINRYNKDPKKEIDIPDFHKLPQPKLKKIRY